MGITSNKKMKILSLIIVSVLLVASAVAVPMTIQEYEKKFGEYWNDPEDLKAAAAELAKAEAEIAAANAENPEAEKLNELSAIPKDEFDSSVDRNTYEAEVDGRDQGLITPVKNQ